ncbi:hypothetical protein GCM10028805_54180 [Spirosoma harenae]
MNDINYNEFKRQIEYTLDSYKFRDLILSNEPLKNDLFNEFINSNKEPSFHLFIQKYVTDEQWNEAHQPKHKEDSGARRQLLDAENKVNEALREFYSLKSAGAIEKIYFDYNILSTGIIKNLLEIEKKFNLFKRIILDSSNNFEYYTEAQVFANNIAKLLLNFENSIWISKVAKAILEDDENTSLEIRLWTKQGLHNEKESYQRLKEHFNFHLSNYLSQLINYSDIEKISDKNYGKQAFSSFDKLFHTTEDLEICMNALCRIDPPLINGDRIWIDSKRGKKSMLVAWWDAVKNSGRAYSPELDTDLAKLLNEYIPRLDLETKDAGIFRQDTTVRTKYYPHFLALIPKKQSTKKLT